MTTPLTATERQARLKAIAERAGVPVKIVARAFKDRDVNASDYFRICAAAGMDPFTGEPGRPGREPCDFSFFFLAANLLKERIDQNHTAAQAAEASGISAASMSRLENAMIVSVETVQKVCRYMGKSPFEFCVGTPNVGEPSGVKRPPRFHGKHKRKDVDATTEPASAT